MMTYGAETRAETSIRNKIPPTKGIKIIRIITGHTLNDKKKVKRKDNTK